NVRYYSFKRGESYGFVPWFFNPADLRNSIQFSPFLRPFSGCSNNVLSQMNYLDIRIETYIVVSIVYNHRDDRISISFFIFNLYNYILFKIFQIFLFTYKRGRSTDKETCYGASKTATHSSNSYSVVCNSLRDLPDPVVVYPKPRGASFVSRRTLSPCDAPLSLDEYLSRITYLIYRCSLSIT
ncbi:hypothetical protein ALC62_01610, partial [Cyphomyrmex costatus]